MASQFNAIDYAQQLAAAGVSQAQAVVHANALSQALTACAASKADLAQLEEKLTTRMDMFEIRIIARIEAFEAKVNLQLAELRGELAQMRGELAVMRAERKYDRRLINLVLAMQVALIVKMFFP
jgi:hypothetical protein